MQVVDQNQYDSIHEFNIHWPYGFNIRIFVWNLKSVIILLKNCRRVEPFFFYVLNLNGSLCLGIVNT